MISFDTEDNGNGEVFLIDFYNGSSHVFFDKKDFKTQKDLRIAAIDYIISSSEKIFCAHNIEYDIVNVFRGFLNLLIMYYSNKLLYVKIKDTKKKIIDSFNFSFTSIKTLGEVIGKPKFETKNFYNIVYCQRDAEICYDYLKQFEQNIKDEFNIKIKNTLAGTSQRIFLKKFCEYKITGINTDKNYLNAYYGGRSEAFKIGEFQDKYIYVLDINSSYPTAMQNNKLPISQAIKVKKISNSTQWIARCIVTIKDVDIPILPYRKQLLYFPIGTFETWINSEEYFYTLKRNQIENIKFLEIYEFPESAYVFSGFVEYFYKERKKAKDSGDNFRSNLLKLVLNSTYGRFALSKGMYVLSEGMDENSLFKENNLDYVKIDIENTNTINYAIPLFITAFARLQLYDLIEKVQKINGEILYCDTDSVFFYFNNKKSLQNQVEEIYNNIEINTHLGNYSLKAYTGASIYNVKSYMMSTFYEDEIAKCKGIPKNNRVEYLKTGSTTYKRPMKLRAALRGVQGISANVWNDFYIENHGKYKKRKIIDCKKIYSDTLPLKGEEIK